MKKKILIIVENAPVPFDTRVMKEAVSLHEAGYEVTVLCPRMKIARAGYEMIGASVSIGTPCRRKGTAPLATCGNTVARFSGSSGMRGGFICGTDFDVIQGCNPPDDIFLVALPFKLFGVKYIFDHHDVIPELYLSKYAKQGILYKAQVLLEKLTYRFSDVVMATNASYSQLAITRGRLAPEDVFIVRNGPDLETFKAVPPNPALKHGKAYLVGYVGNMSDQDGLDILVRSGTAHQEVGSYRYSFYLRRRRAGSAPVFERCFRKRISGT